MWPSSPYVIIATPGPKSSARVAAPGVTHMALNAPRVTHDLGCFTPTLPRLALRSRVLDLALASGLSG